MIVVIIYSTLQCRQIIPSIDTFNNVIIFIKWPFMYSVKKNTGGFSVCNWLCHKIYKAMHALSSDPQKDQRLRQTSADLHKIL